MQDVVPPERFEPDVGADPDVDPLHVALANVLDGLDEYPEIVDPVLFLLSDAASAVTGQTLTVDCGEFHT